jgi:uncharacterized 2Fe-2S/4Fe-4S cluster protein (DUF4445 family)
MFIVYTPEGTRCKYRALADATLDPDCTPQFQGRDEIEAVVRKIEKIETAVEPKFKQHFVEAMAIPHKTAVFANLTKVVTLPPPKDVQTMGDDGGERRRRRRG